MGTGYVILELAGVRVHVRRVVVRCLRPSVLVSKVCGGRGDGDDERPSRGWLGGSGGTGDFGFQPPSVIWAFSAFSRLLLFGVARTTTEPPNHPRDLRSDHRP